MHEKKNQTEKLIVCVYISCLVKNGRNYKSMQHMNFPFDARFIKLTHVPYISMNLHNFARCYFDFLNFVCVCSYCCCCII